MPTTKFRRSMLLTDEEFRSLFGRPGHVRYTVFHDGGIPEVTVQDTSEAWSSVTKYSKGEVRAALAREAERRWLETVRPSHVSDVATSGQRETRHRITIVREAMPDAKIVSAGIEGAPSTFQAHAMLLDCADEHGRINMRELETRIAAVYAQLEQLNRSKAHTVALVDHVLDGESTAVNDIAAMHSRLAKLLDPASDSLCSRRWPDCVADLVRMCGRVADEFERIRKERLDMLADMTKGDTC